MKKLFIEAKYKDNVVLKNITVLPKKIGLCSSVQFIDSINKMKKQLEEKGKEVTLIKGNHSKHCGQILGCDVLRDLKEYEIDAFLYIGDGMFHPKALMIKGNKDVFSYNPFTEDMNQIEKKDIEILKIKHKAALNKFYSSEEIGVIITTKPGQNNSKKAEQLEKKYPNKKFYMFIADTIDFNDLENFNFIKCWVNTACPRISYDDMIAQEKNIVDIDDVLI